MKLSERDGFTEDYKHPLVKALRELRTFHGLHGCVLISFDEDRVAVNSSGRDELFGAAMEILGDQILTAIDDGKFDPNLGEIEAKANGGKR